MIRLPVIYSACTCVVIPDITFKSHTIFSVYFPRCRSACKLSPSEWIQPFWMQCSYWFLGFFETFFLFLLTSIQWGSFLWREIFVICVYYWFRWWVFSPIFPEYMLSHSATWLYWWWFSCSAYVQKNLLFPLKNHQYPLIFISTHSFHSQPFPNPHLILQAPLVDRYTFYTTPLPTDTLHKFRFSSLEQPAWPLLQ